MNNAIDSNQECNGQRRRFRQRKCENGMRQGCGKGQKNQKNKGLKQ